MRNLAFFFAAIVLAFAVGCNSPKSSFDDSLKFFGITYSNYQQVYNKAPSNWSEFLELSNAPGLEDDMKKLVRVRDSEYTVVWNVDCQADDVSTKALAYPVSPEKPVLFADGSLRKLTPDEFKEMASNLVP